MQMTAIYPHPAGIHQAQRKIINGENREEVLVNARAACPIERYLGRLVADDGRTTVWEEHTGWL